MRILLVSQMYPGPRDPDFGAFVAQIERELARRGHAIDRVAVDHRGGSRAKHPAFAARIARAALRARPDVVYAHFLVPAGLLGVLAGAVRGVPAIITAHGQDVRNAGRHSAVRAATALACRRAAGIVCVSDALRRELETHVPAAAGRVEVIDCGVDLERFRGRDPEPTRRTLGWSGDGPRFLFAGALEERKNVVALAEAFAQVGRGSLAVVGDGALRPRLEGRPGVRLAGRIAPERVPEWMTACDVLCLPSVTEPFGQVLLEAMASERSVVATRVGGPPEFVPPEAGVLVDPASVTDIARGLRAAAALPSPNVAARAAAAEHDVHRQVDRIEGLLRRAAGASA